MRINFKSTKLPVKDGEIDNEIEPIVHVSKTTHDVNSEHFDSSEFATSSSLISSITSRNNSKPLTWKEARMRLRDVLTSYMMSPPVECNTEVRPSNSSNSAIKELLNFWFSRNMDCFFGSILCTLSLLILSIALYINERNKGAMSERSSTSIRLFTSHIIASVLFLAGSILSVWLLQRRQMTSARGSETKKRHIVASFLSVLDEMLNSESNDNPISDSVDNENDRGHEIHISGTSLTDIYRVYRLSEDGDSGKWHKLPSLLLVEGDFIALQHGDLAPADCKVVKWSKALAHSSSTSLKMMSTPNLRAMANSQQILNTQKEPIIIKAGETVQTSKAVKIGTKSSVQSCDKSFPPGKSKIPENSSKLLHLTNHSRVFQVLESPILQFLRKQAEPKKKPRIQRKVKETRIALYFFSIITLILSYVIISIRHSVEEVNFSVVLSLPLLAVIGTLPITTPLILIMLEIIGTCRILVAVHPYASNVKHIENQSRLFIRYFTRGIETRLQLANFCAKEVLESRLIDFPIASFFLYEKLGVVTALSLIDDELACDPVSTPQQLLIPTSKGLKLLDLFPKYDEDSDDESDDDKHLSIRRRGGSIASSIDSDSEWGDDPPHENDNRSGAKNKKLQALIKFRRKYRKRNLSSKKFEPPKPTEVQFEDPNWWKYLPTLKCIGLASLLVDSPEQIESKDDSRKSDNYIPGTAENSLIRHVKQHFDKTHLRLLSECIGFKTEPNSFGMKGDITAFEEVRRIRIIATRLLHHRMNLDRHHISLEESRSWGLLRPDSTSVIVKDHRSKGVHLLTVGDGRVVTDLCSSSWQNENITPLIMKDRQMIAEYTNEWASADLDVTAFSYAPIISYGEKFAVQHPGREHHKSAIRPMTHLVDNRISDDVPAITHKENGADDWSLIKNQIFLGLLGSCVSPRKDVTPLIDDCTHAGVRFVYFSPRNMRRSKELASQMGIDVAWNCAISLRPLDEGEEKDEHRMTSDYADWNVKARLPHGVEDVKRHLQDVDNVPLLVSLFTDVTKRSTCEMVDVFQDHHDTVLSLGLSHLSQNNDIFNTSDLSFGDDVLFKDVTNNAVTNEEDPEPIQTSPSFKSSLHHNELLFVSKIASQSCAFNLSLGQNGLLHIAEIIAKGRAALNSGTASGIFVIQAGIALTLSIFFCLLSASTAIPIIPTSGIVLYVQIYTPLIALSMAFTADDEKAMTIVPPKNDLSITFAPGERQRLFLHLTFRALMPAISSHLVFLVAFGSLVIDFDPDALEGLCDLDASSSQWTDVIRCSDLNTYVGKSSTSASSLMLAELSLCVIAQSASFLLGNNSLLESNPIAKNRAWFISSLFSVFIIFIHLYFTLEKGTLQSLPWYLFLIAFFFPVVSVLGCEIVKKRDKRFVERAEKLRRLQFETRLGMWSPK